MKQYRHGNNLSKIIPWLLVVETVSPWKPILEIYSHSVSEIIYLGNHC